MNLYKIENGIGTYWVIAAHPTEAEQKLKKILNDADYGFYDKREMKSIHLVAKAITDNWLTDKFLIL